MATFKEYVKQFTTRPLEKNLDLQFLQEMKVSSEKHEFERRELKNIPLQNMVRVK